MPKTAAALLADLQQGRQGETRDDAIRRVDADALESFVMAELKRLADRPGLQPDDAPALLMRLEVRAADTHLVLDRAVLIGDDHPELALEDLRARHCQTKGRAGAFTPS